EDEARQSEPAHRCPLGPGQQRLIEADRGPKHSGPNVRRQSGWRVRDSASELEELPVRCVQRRESPDRQGGQPPAPARELYSHGAAEAVSEPGKALDAGRCRHTFVLFDGGFGGVTTALSPLCPTYPARIIRENEEEFLPERF